MKARALVALAAAGALAIGVAGVVGARETVFRAESDSMSPAVKAGDLVVAARQGSADVERSDIVVFHDPGDWARTAARLTGVDEVSSTFVKRVVALPGERVTCCDVDGRMQVDGAALDEPYLPASVTIASILAFDVTVPDDAVFVLGDNRAASIDSRYLGPVPLSSIVATEQFTLDLP